MSTHTDRMKRIAILLLASVSVFGQGPRGASGPVAGNARGAGAGRYVEPTPYNFNEQGKGWQPLFDGTSLNGWDGPTDVFHVENGAITAEARAADNLPPVYMYWAGGEVKNFEFRTEIKLEGEGGNSGIQFRALRLGPSTGKYSQWESRGYQADYDYTNSQTGALIECCAGPRRGVPPRPDKAGIGQIVRTALTDGEKPSLVGTTGDPAELKKLIRVGDWNEIHLIVRGTTMMYFINGRLMSVMLDDNPKMFTDHGEIAIQLEGRGDRKVSFRNIRLKVLP
ncbi:MAG TPA: DUF1080 domain-containing protein [Bryobacteraceae bacterium]|nr:DUF1080 domain-containing protein [Bryobacteraceae bacterium]